MLPTLAFQNSQSCSRVFTRRRNFHRFSFSVSPSAISLSGQSRPESQAKMTNSSIPIDSNQDILERGLAANRAKREARSRSMQEKYDRNLRTKRLLHTNASSTSEVNDALTMYALKIMVDEDLRRDLKLTGREKRGRVFLERDSDAVWSLRSLKFELHSFFRALRKDTFTISAGYPQVEVGGMNVNLATNETSEYWPIESDADVERTFSVADDFFVENDSVKGRSEAQRPWWLLDR
jgi:hypothetical protein